MNWILWIVLSLYVLASVGLVVYGLNTYLLLFLFGRKVDKQREEKRALREAFAAREKEEGEKVWPLVTTQIPLYNERNVAERVIRAVAAMDYPEGKHQIQVVDDSDDETMTLVDEVAADLRAQGVWIDVCRRKIRTGYKAGGLKEAMETAAGEFYAIFDSDFVPHADFLKQMVPLFGDEKTGLVQSRWGHLNADHSLLTRAQSVGVDGHFVVEQVARAESGLFLNFNGTAGIWRKEAILDGGGWQADTLTEDLDLSYRCQLKGWKLAYALDVEVPAELPETYSAFKNQQFRWAKGSVQTARKLLGTVLRSPSSGLAKLQAVFHLLHYMAHFLMFSLAVLALPLALLLPQISPGLGVWVLVLPLVLATLGPSVLYMVSQRFLYPKDWWKKFLYLPGMVALGFGICISNTKAVMEALLGVKSGFVRTPKRGQTEVKKYRAKVGWVPVAELLAACYCGVTVAIYLWQGTYGAVIYFLIYGTGFLMVGLKTLAEQRART